MVQHKDLRVGNYIDYQDSVYKVTAISPKKIQLQPAAGVEAIKVDVALLNGITVTDELVRQCGFEQNWLFPHLKAYRHKKHLFNINIVGKACEVSFGLIAANMAIIYQRNMYLHQLQNLYYALTLEELEIDWPAQTEGSS